MMIRPSSDTFRNVFIIGWTSVEGGQVPHFQIFLPKKQRPNLHKAAKQLRIHLCCLAALCFPGLGLLLSASAPRPLYLPTESDDARVSTRRPVLTLSSQLQTLSSQWHRII